MLIGRQGMRLLFGEMLRHVAKLAALVCLLNGTVALAKTDPAYTWTTLSTPHFLIHFHQGEDQLAQRAAVIAEDVHAKLTLRMKSQPRSRTNIVMVDALDDANGWATVLPYNLITLYLTPPLGEPGFGAQNYDDWMRLLITHEYTHIVQMDMLNGVSSVLNSIFGNLYFPNMWQPVWLLEGLAVYEETELTGGGRNRSPYTDMVLRMAVLDNDFPHISHAANYTEQWPAGETPYLFGGEFTSYIAGKYGRDKLADISLTYSDRPPFNVEGTAHRVLDTDYSSLWNEWQGVLATRYQAQKQQVEAQGLSVSRALTHRAYQNISPAISPDGKRIAYAVENADTHPAIHLMNIDGSDDRELVRNETLSASAINWSPDGKGIYYTRVGVERNVSLYNEIYYYDIVRGCETRLTRGLRARDPAPSPDGSKLLFVTTRLGKTRLGTIALPRERAARVEDVSWLGDESDIQYETPRYSPDGQRIVVGVRQPDGYKDIWILDAQGQKIDALMHDRAVDGGAVWSADGKTLYFASDRSGIFNLYAYDVATKKIMQVSNVLGGAFMPAPTPDGNTLVYADYGSRGFDIRALDNKPAAWKEAAPYRDPYPVMSYNEQPVATELSAYNPLPTLAPHFWLPYFGYSYYSGALGGLITLGSDAVQRHTYLLSALYGPKNHRAWYDFTYLYDGLYPTLGLHVADTDMTYSNLLKQQIGSSAQRDYIERNRYVDASLIFPLFDLDVQHELTFGYRRTINGALTDLPPWPGYDGVSPFQGVQAAGRLDYLFNNALRYGYSISPEDGRTVELGYVRSTKGMGSDLVMKKYSVDWHEYIDFPFEHHVLLLRGYGGKASGDAPPQGAFQLGGDNPGDIAINVNEQSIYLRGYPVNEYRGQKVALLSVEYRFPVKNIEYGFGNTPFFFKRMHGAVFAEAGSAWDGRYDSKNLKRSVGLEARMDVSLAYTFPITLRVGIARAMDDNYGLSLIANIWYTL